MTIQRIDWCHYHGDAEWHHIPGEFDVGVAPGKYRAQCDIRDTLLVPVDLSGGNLQAAMDALREYVNDSDLDDDKACVDAVVSAYLGTD